MASTFSSQKYRLCLLAETARRSRLYRGRPLIGRRHYSCGANRKQREVRQNEGVEAMCAGWPHIMRRDTRVWLDYENIVVGEKFELAVAPATTINKNGDI